MPVGETKGWEVMSRGDAGCYMCGNLSEMAEVKENWGGSMMVW